MEYIAFDKASFDNVIRCLKSAQEISRNYVENQEYPASSGYLSGAITSALIHMDVIAQFHTHEGDAWNAGGRPVITYKQDFSSTELPAEVRELNTVI